MTSALHSLEAGPYRLNLSENGDTSFSHSALGHDRPVLFRTPEFVVKINGQTINQAYELGYGVAAGSLFPITQETTLGCLNIRIGLGFHPLHQVPTRSIIVRNDGEATIEGVDVEVWFHMPDDSPYAVLSSSDSVQIGGQDRSGAGEPVLIANVPTPIAHSATKLDRVRACQVNAVVFHRYSQRIATLPAKWEAVMADSRPSHRQGHTVVDGSPSYRLTSQQLEPGHMLAASVPTWCLRTTKDSGGFSGFGFVVHASDWVGALACLNAPTHLGTGNSVIDSLLGLLSPIEFYDDASPRSIASAVDRLQGLATFVYAVLPEWVSDEVASTLHRDVSQTSHLTVVTVPPMPRSILSMKVWEAVSELLAASVMLPPPLPTEIVVTDGRPDSLPLLAAISPGRLVIPDGDPVGIAHVCNRIAAKKVSLVNSDETLEVQIQEAGRASGVDLSSTEFVRVLGEEAAVRGGHVEGPWRWAARRCVANAVVSMFMVSDTRLIDQMCEQARLSVQALGIEDIPPGLAERDIALLQLIVDVHPPLAVKSVSYAAAGPAALVVGVIQGERWHDALLGAAFARAKQLPAAFVTIASDVRQALAERMRALDLCVESKDGRAIDDAISAIGSSWLPEPVIDTMLRVARKAITIFSPDSGIPWELSSWQSAQGAQVSFGQEFDIGRMTTTSGVRTAAIVYGTLHESLQPMFGMDAVLFAWDDDADRILGSILFKEVTNAVERGFVVDVLAPAMKLREIEKHCGKAANLRLRAVCSKESLLASLGNTYYSLVSITAHGTRTKARSTALNIGGEQISGSEFPAMNGHPLVVVNSCWGADTQYDEAHAMNNSLVAYLIAAGAFQVLAPIYPISGWVAAKLNRALFDYGMTRSAARVNRRLKQSAVDESNNGQLWFVAYGDPSVSKFFEFDGIWELEDTVEKVTKMFPVVDGWNNKRISTDDVLKMARRHIRGTLDLAGKWGYASLAGMIERRGQFGPGGNAILENSEAQLRKVLEGLHIVVEQVERNYEQLINASGAQ